MKRYRENEEATKKVLRSGPNPWESIVYTGDLFRADEEGFLYFVARKDDIIKTRGEKASPLLKWSGFSTVLFRGELPKTGTGKINHRLLQEEAASSE